MGYITDGLIRCKDCDLMYSAAWDKCPHCQSDLADHLVIRMKKGASVKLLKHVLSHRADIDDVKVVRNMLPDHRGFTYQLCEQCHKRWVLPEHKICQPCERSFKVIYDD